MLPCDITPTIYVNGRTKIYRIPWHVFLFSCCQNPWGADLWFDKCISKNIGHTLSKKDMLQTNQKYYTNRNKSNCNREKDSQPTIIINKHRIFFEFQITLSTCIQFKIVQSVISSKTSECWDATNFQNESDFPYNNVKDEIVMILVLWSSP